MPPVVFPLYVLSLLSIIILRFLVVVCALVCPMFFLVYCILDNTEFSQYSPPPFLYNLRGLLFWSEKHTSRSAILISSDLSKNVNSYIFLYLTCCASYHVIQRIIFNMLVSLIQKDNFLLCYLKIQCGVNQDLPDALFLFPLPMAPLVYHLYNNMMGFVLDPSTFVYKYMRMKRIFIFLILNIFLKF